MGCMDIAINICWRLHNCGRWGGGGYDVCILAGICIWKGEMWWCWQLSDIGFTSSLVSLSLSTCLFFGLCLPICISGFVYLSVFWAVYLSVFQAVFTCLYFGLSTCLYFGLGLPGCILGWVYLAVFWAVPTCLYFRLCLPACILGCLVGFLSLFFLRKRDRIFFFFVFPWSCLLFHPHCVTSLLSFSFFHLSFSFFCCRHFCVWYCFRPHFTLSCMSPRPDEECGVSQTCHAAGVEAGCFHHGALDSQRGRCGEAAGGEPGQTLLCHLGLSASV